MHAMVSRYFITLCLSYIMYPRMAQGYQVTVMNACSESILLYEMAFNTPSSEWLSAGQKTVRDFAPGTGAHMLRAGENPQATLAEFSTDGGAWFDISIIPTGHVGPGYCGSLHECKQVTGGTGFNLPMQITPDKNLGGSCKELTCMNDGCDDAYQYPMDNLKTHSCPGDTNFVVTFCPGGSGGQAPAPVHAPEVTQAPETQAPTPEVTPAPETQAPETQAPETQAPETQAPETQAPEQEYVHETKEPESELLDLIDSEEFEGYGSSASGSESSGSESSGSSASGSDDLDQSNSYSQYTHPGFKLDAALLAPPTEEEIQQAHENSPEYQVHSISTKDAGGFVNQPSVFFLVATLFMVAGIVIVVVIVHRQKRASMYQGRSKTPANVEAYTHRSMVTPCVSTVL